jgi:glutamate decarboxylase
MVHLQSIPHEDEVNDKLVREVKKVHLDLAPCEESQFTTSVYGSKFAAADLPKLEMPENEMPKEVAYRMIKDDLSLDGNPMLNLASFVTTYMVSTILSKSPTMNSH